MSFDAHMTIGGKPLIADDWVTIPNSAHLTTVVGRYPSRTVGRVGVTVGTAVAAFPNWQASRVAEQVAPLAAENGKLPSESAIDSAVTFVNAHSIFALRPDGPVGGAKQSGCGYEMSAEAVDSYTQLQSITNTHL